MKRIFVVLVLVGLVVGLVGCGGDSAEVARLQAELDALRAESDYASLEYELIEYEQDIESEPEEDAVWVIRYFVDQFNQPTEYRFISGETRFTGTFGNTAVNNARLSANMVICNDYIAIVLFEYGNNRVMNASSRSSQSYNIIINVPPNNTRHTLSGSIRPNGDRIIIDGGATGRSHNTSVISALRGTGDIDFFIERADRTTTNYLFSVPASNFANIWDNIVW